MRSFAWLSTSFARIAIALFLILGTIKVPVQEAVARSCTESMPDDDDDDREAEEAISVTSARQVTPPKHVETLVASFTYPSSASASASIPPTIYPLPVASLCARLRC
jgi:hypothetical protein